MSLLEAVIRILAAWGFIDLAIRALVRYPLLANLDRVFRDRDPCTECADLTERADYLRDGWSETLQEATRLKRDLILKDAQIEDLQNRLSTWTNGEEDHGS